MINKLLWSITKLIIRWLFVFIKIFLVILGRELLVRKQAEQRAEERAKREAQSRMNEFISIASHELKTPLTSIKGNVQLMRRKLKKSVDIASSEESLSRHETKQLLIEARDLIERTDKQITHLTKLVTTLIESSRINTNSIDLLLEECELDTLIHEIVKDVHYVPSLRTVHVKVCTDHSILVMADVARIKQVVIHYLSNAHKFSPLEAPIEVKLLEEGKITRVFVRDEGPGIPISEQQRVWERFYRIPNTKIHNGSEVGMGLGLHICRTFIEQHQGQVGLYSTPGKGSTFWFTLPLVSKEMNG